MIVIITFNIVHYNQQFLHFYYTTLYYNSNHSITFFLICYKSLKRKNSSLVFNKNDNIK